MIVRKALLFALAIPFLAQAETKRIECGQVTDTGVSQIIVATIDDASDKAEVQLYAHTAECAANNSCDTNIFKKDTLPTVIRLSSSLSPGRLSYTTIIDIDRTDLSVVTRSTLSGVGQPHETTARGHCTVSVVPGKKVL